MSAPKKHFSHFLWTLMDPKLHVNFGLKKRRGNEKNSIFHVLFQNPFFDIFRQIFTEETRKIFFGTQLHYESTPLLLTHRKMRRQGKRELEKKHQKKDQRGLTYTAAHAHAGILEVASGLEEIINIPVGNFACLRILHHSKPQPQKKTHTHEKS